MSTIPWYIQTIQTLYQLQYQKTISDNFHFAGGIYKEVCKWGLFFNFHFVILCHFNFFTSFYMPDKMLQSADFIDYDDTNAKLMEYE